MSHKALKVLFIAGFGRSGSTLLDNILGGIDGFFSLGELIYIWDRCLKDNRLCACGTPFRECPVWAPITDASVADFDDQKLQKMIEVRERLGPGSALLRSRFGRRPLSDAGVEEFLAANGRIYRAIQSETGCRVIVDSSKWPAYGYLLKQLPDIDPYFVHLMRDPRPVAYSWQKKKVYDPSGETPMYMSRFSLPASCRLWNKWNLVTEILLGRPRERYLRLRYEDFVERPRQAVERVIEFAGEAGCELPFVSEQEVRLGPNHSVGGNPSRFDSGVVAIRRDDSWRQRMSRRQRLAVLGLTWPLFLRYGYPR